jgi:hypothetical protein
MAATHSAVPQVPTWGIFLPYWRILSSKWSIMLRSIANLDAIALLYPRVPAAIEQDTPHVLLAPDAGLPFQAGALPGLCCADILSRWRRLHSSWLILSLLLPGWRLHTLLNGTFVA